MSFASKDWDELKRMSSNLESRLNSKLSDYEQTGYSISTRSKFSAPRHRKHTNGGNSDSDVAGQLSNEIGKVLDELQKVIDAMYALVDGDHIRDRTVRRLRDITQRNQKQFYRTR